MRACCKAQRLIVFRSIHTAGVATSTARLKTGADDPHDEAMRWARRVFRPTNLRATPPLFSGCATTENRAIGYQ
jgi:hypothetical protein